MYTDSFFSVTNDTEMMSLPVPFGKQSVSLEEMDMRCELAESWVEWLFKLFNRG